MSLLSNPFFSSRVTLVAIAAWTLLASSNLAQRVAWTSSRVVGSPEPPLPYTTERVFEEIEWKNPIYAKTEPGTNNLVVVMTGDAQRPAKLVRLVDSTDSKETTSLLEIEKQLVYGIEFHPDYEKNGFLYVHGNGPVGKPERKNRIARYTVDRDSGECNVDSELVIIEWRSMGHDGGELAFGADGMLYISSGDGTTDSDTWLSAQDITNLNGGVIRIDVDHPTEDRPYSIPKDNPFLDIPDARGELWAFGLRNPWRLWADRKSDQIWVGVNGQDLWETVHLLGRGENYGWSVYEGNHPFYANRQRGPAPITPATVEHHHREARSLTGGVVYRGDKLPELDGAYVYGDYGTGKIWGVRHDGKRVTWKAELADTSHSIVGFAISPTGELLVIDHGGSLNRMVPKPAREPEGPFPQRLSETGLFASVRDHEVQPGVVPYSVRAEGWHDGAVAERFIALPGETVMKYRAKRALAIPEAGVLVQTLSQPSGRRIETRLLTKQQNEWVGYSYLWNESQDDAELVSREGQELKLDWDGKTRTWKVPSRAECSTCHGREIGFTLGMSHLQLSGAELDRFTKLGLFEKPPESPDDAEQLVDPYDAEQLVDPYDETHPLETRARSYLHTNCACCHIRAGGGNARILLEFHHSIGKTNLLGSRPQHATFGLANAQIVAPGEPEDSVLLHRIARRGSGQMPPVFSTKVDTRAVQLMRDWIGSLEKKERNFVRAWTLAELAPHLDEVTSDRDLDSGKTLFNELACQQCHRFAGRGGGAGPKLTGIGKTKSTREILEAIVKPSAAITKGFETTVLVLDDGTTLQGRIEVETSDTLTMHTSESFGEAIVVSKDDIEERLTSDKSSMPSGLLNTLERDQILDLLAWLLHGEEK